MSWIILECACAFALAGFLLSSGEYTTNGSNESSSTSFSNFINSTIYTTEDASNQNTFDSSSSNNLNASTTEHDFSVSSERSTESLHNILSSTVSDGKQLASDVATKSVLDTESSQEQNSSKSKDYLESRSVKKLDLGRYNDTESSTGITDSHFSTEKGSLQTENFNQEENSTQSGNSTEEKLEVSSKQNSSVDYNERTTSEAKKINETTTAATLDSIQNVKSTVIKSTRKRSVDDKSSDFSTTTDVFNDTDDKSTHSATEASKISDGVQGKDESHTENESTTGGSVSNDVTIIEKAYESGNVTINEAVRSESSYGTTDSLKEDLSSKDMRATRKRRMKHEENITFPSPTSSMPTEEETETVMDGSSSFDFPEHLSLSDTEVGLDVLQPESEWTAFSSHSSNSESIIKESNILSDEYQINNQEYMDRPEAHPSSHPSALSEELVIVTHSSKTSTNFLEDHNQNLQTQSSGEVTSDDHLPSDYDRLNQDSTRHSISIRSTQSEDNLPSITTISYGDKETELSTSDKPAPSTSSQDTIRKENPSTVSVHDIESQESSTTSNNDSEIISVLNSALRQGIVLEPPAVAEARNATEHTLSSESQKTTSINLETTAETETKTQVPETVSEAVISSVEESKMKPESASRNDTSDHKSNGRSAAENMDNNTLNTTKEAIINQFPSADASTSSTTPTAKVTPYFEWKLDDVMLGDSHHLAALSPNDSKHDNISSTEKTTPYFEWKLDDVMLSDSHHIAALSPNDSKHDNVSSTVLVKSDSNTQIIDGNKQATSLQSQAKEFAVRPVKIKVSDDNTQSSQVGDISSNKIVGPVTTTDVLAEEPLDLPKPQTLSSVLRSSDSESSNVENLSTAPSLVEANATSAASSALSEINESVVEDLLGNKTVFGLSEDGNSTTVIADPHPSSPPVKTTTYRTGILKPRPRVPGSNPDSPRPTRKSILSTQRPRATTAGEPVAIFNKKKTRAGSITSSTTQRPTSPYSVQRIHFANRVPDSMIPLGPGISIDVTLPATTTTETPTTTEEPYSEEPFTEPTQMPSLSSEDDVTLVKMAGTVVVIKGIRWNDQLYHRNSPQYKDIAKDMHVRLERLFRTSPIAKRVWNIEIDGFSEKLPMRGTVIVDFIVSIIKYADHGEFFGIENMTAEEREEKRLAAIFNDQLKKKIFGRYIVDPALTEFKVLEEERRNMPTEAPGPEPPIPQWAIAVIVVGAASLIFILLFAAVTVYGRHHMRRRYSNKLSEEDIDRSGDWESKMAAAYENLAADTIYDAEDGSIESMKRPQRPTHHSRHQTRLKRYDSWYSGNITVSPKQTHRNQVHRIVY